MYLSTYIGAFIIAVASLGVWNWLGALEENKIIDIMASREPDLGLPVYAQFTVTQLFEVPEGRKLHRLEVPIYFPSGEIHVDNDLRYGQRSVWQWRVRPDQAGLMVARLPLLTAEPLAGQLELTFAAPHVSHDQQDVAPRLFIESADEQYPQGHYRIAANDKQGDVSLTVYEQRTVRDRIVELWTRRPLKVAGQAGALGLLMMLLASLPSVLVRMRGGSHQVGKQPSERQRQDQSPEG
jgi:hypothetical protein